VLRGSAGIFSPSYTPFLLISTNYIFDPLTQINCFLLNG
jgi:hypothetical protein